MLNPISWIRGAGKLIVKVGKMQNAVQQSRDVYDKVEDIMNKYSEVDDDVKDLLQEVKEAKEAIAGIF